MQSLNNMKWPESYIGKIIEGDCLEVMKNIPDKSIDALITDPPFAFTGGSSNSMTTNIDSQFFSYWWKEVSKNIARILKSEAEG
ncbi:unnamed protein product, partial [marine sediment metagenome]